MEGNPDGLGKVLKDLYEKTGVNAYLTPKGGEETAFEAEWNGRTVQLYLEGSAELEAKLIAYLLSETGPAVTGTEQLKSVLFGEGGKVQAFRYLSAHGIADGPCFAAEVVPAKRVKDAFEHIGHCLEGSGRAIFTEEGRIGVVKFLEDGQSPIEFARFLSQSLYEEAGIRARVGVGCEMGSFGEISVSYAQAASALRMGEMLGDKGDVHSYREYLLVRMLSDVPREKIRESLSRFRIGGEEEVFGDEELFGTAEAFLESDLNLSETSRALFIHRNTLSYRLDKIERLTGLNIRKFPDAVTFRVITVLLKLIKE